MFNIYALKIDKNHITYLCPHCSTIRGGRTVENTVKNLRKYASMTHTFHRHGSGGELNNRTEFRSSHCLYYNGEIKIHITDDTIRE